MLYFLLGKMKNFVKDLQLRASRKQKTIILPESTDIRILKAAVKITEKSIAKIILIGDQAKIKQQALDNNLDLGNIIIISPKTSPFLNILINTFTKKRQHKGLTLNTAQEIITNNHIFFAAMLVNMGEADGMVAGAINPTRETIRAAAQCIGIKKDTTILSSFFIMILPEKKYGKDGLIFYADCGVNPNPDDQQLAEIAISTHHSYKRLMNISDPKIAFLSYSTKGSAKGESIEKVQSAIDITKNKDPEIIADGEMQFDAAIIPDIGKRKAPGSKIAGKADILIFPDLNAGNIAYKITERLGKAVALGPIIQGTKKPINDLSRGCSIDDIVNITAITALQCEDH